MKIINLYFGLGAVGVVVGGVAGVGEGEGAGEVGEGVAVGEVVGVGVGEGVAVGEVVGVGACAGGCVRSSATAASITRITTIPTINPVFIELKDLLYI